MCDADPYPCSPLVSCYPILGGFVCNDCPAGYSGDGRTCTGKGTYTYNTTNKHGATAPCSGASHSRRTYVSLVPSVTHTEKMGAIQLVFVLKLFLLPDIDECNETPYPCSPLASCTNTQGSFTCGACPGGYTGNGKTCTGNWRITHGLGGVINM